MRDKSTFFCFGTPKSGTTLLQRCLTLHPQVSCPSEHHLDYLLTSFGKLFQTYNNGLDVTDRRTGGQGATHILQPSVHKIFRHAVLEIIHSATDCKEVAGINDNSILDQLAFYRKLFPDSKFIAIFRHPIPTAISAWHYNLSLAQEELDPKHAQLLRQNGSYDDWILLVAEQFNHAVSQFRTVFKSDPNAIAIKYEDLVNSKYEVLERLFEFLKVSVNQATLQNIVNLTQFSVMRASAQRPHFFRAALTSSDESVSAEMQKRVQDLTRGSLSSLGYPMIPELQHDSIATEPSPR